VSVRWVRDLEIPTTADLSLTPSPEAWEDEVLYFLMLDRFSDGNEAGFRSPDSPPGAAPTPRYSPADNGNAISTPLDAARWREAGRSWVGGTLAGVRSKLDYLVGLGVTTLWISPVLKQSGVAPGRQQNYHGYATQDFLAVDRHYGTTEDLRELVDQAHRRGLRVILDVVLNHAGDVFAYQDGDPVYTGQEYPVAGWYDADRNLIPFTPEAAAAAWPDGAVFPGELHPPDTFTRRGRITDWETYPEFVEGDFEALKDIGHGTYTDEGYLPSPALQALTRAYCWWIAHTDLDGLRVDTVKHMEIGATRYFASSVHEFAQSIGKERFLLIGEILGSRAQAFRTLELTGLDAALGLADVQHQLEATAKGWTAPTGYFDLFRNTTELGRDSHTWLRNTVVTSYDDHDMVFQGPDKARFCADPDGPRLALVVLALNVVTLGIPCVYYGSEQCLDGAGGGADADRYIREAMFGGEFGAFRSRGRHVFDPDHPVYRGLAGLLAVRRAEPALRRGRQYLREISGDGGTFGFPTAPAGHRIRSVVAWSRILADRELLCAVNNDPDGVRAAWVTVDAGLYQPGDELRDLFRSDPGPHPPLRVEDRSGRRVVRVELPPGGVAVYGP
jgi:glycosidase